MNMIRQLERLLFPERCIICNQQLKPGKSGISEIPENAGREAILCAQCRTEVQPITKNYCPKCGKKRKHSDQWCYDCGHRSHYYEAGRGMYVYQDPVKKSLAGLKFFGKTWVGKGYGRLMAQYMRENQLVMPDLIIPVPLHWFRKIKRGYNQTEIIAASLAEELNLNLETNLLKKRHPTKPQKGLDITRRADNLSASFGINNRKNRLVEGKIILLVDDIYTTGATIDECAKTLLEHGAQKVYFITVAIGIGK